MKNLMIVLLLLASFASCKKKSEDAAPPSLLGKWALVSSSYKYVNNGVTSFEDNYTGIAADYVEFRSDGTLYSFVDGSTSTSTYALQANNKVSIDGDVYDIQNLTTTSVALYAKVVVATNSYEETKVSLKR